MKLIIAIMSDDDSGNVSLKLTEDGFSATKLSTTGGFLRSGNTTFLIGAEEDRIDRAIEIIRSNSKKRTQIAPPAPSISDGLLTSYPAEVIVGGATVFVLSVDRMSKY